MPHPTSLPATKSPLNFLSVHDTPVDGDATPAAVHPGDLSTDDLRRARPVSEFLPETILAKESELTSEERRLTNFVDFSGEGRGSHALTDALIETEGRVEALRSELGALRRNRKKVFQAPPMEWIEERLSRVQEVLERRTEQTAPLLRDVLGTIRLEPQRGNVGRPYCLARTSFDCIALIETPPGAEAPDSGSNSLRKWRRRESNPRPRMNPAEPLRA